MTRRKLLSVWTLSADGSGKLYTTDEEPGDLPGVLEYGATRDEAVARAEALALRVIADRLEHGEVPIATSVTFA